MLLTPSPILAHGGKGTIDVVAVANAHEAILQPRAQRALHLAAALLPPKPESFFVSLWHGGSLMQQICPASPDSSSPLSLNFPLADSLPLELLNDRPRSSSAEASEPRPAMPSSRTLNLWIALAVKVLEVGEISLEENISLSQAPTGPGRGRCDLPGSFHAHADSHRSSLGCDRSCR